MSDTSLLISFLSNIFFLISGIVFIFYFLPRIFTLSKEKKSFIKYLAFFIFINILVFYLEYKQSHSFDINLKEPLNGLTTNEKNVLFKGNQKGEYNIFINSTKVNIDTKTSDYSAKFNLDNAENVFYIRKFPIYDFIHNNPTETKIVRIYRKFTNLELQQIKLEGIEKRNIFLADSLTKIRKSALKEKKWFSSKAGKLQIKHPEWTNEECERVLQNFYWIGMTYEMLIYQHGRPDAKNPSNYGNGTSWQYCWNNITPSCYYDKDNDGRIDSYN